MTDSAKRARGRPAHPLRAAIARGDGVALARVLDALRANHWMVATAARDLGVHKATLQKWLRDLPALRGLRTATHRHANIHRRKAQHPRRRPGRRAVIARRLALHLRSLGASYAEIGNALGISRQRAHQIVRRQE